MRIQLQQASASSAPQATEEAKQHIVQRLQLHLQHSQPTEEPGEHQAACWALNCQPSGQLHGLCRQHRRLAADAAAQVRTGHHHHSGIARLQRHRCAAHTPEVKAWPSHCKLCGQPSLLKPAAAARTAALARLVPP